MKIERFHVGRRMSEIAVHQQTVYLAGQIAENATQDIVGQTREVLGHVDRLLAEAGSSKNHILMCQVYLSDMQHFDGMNAAWDEWVSDSGAPPRATVEAKLARPEWLVEIVVTAAVATAAQI